MDSKTRTYFENATHSTIIESDLIDFVYYSKKVKTAEDRLMIDKNMMIFILQGNKGVAVGDQYFELHEGDALFVKQESLLVCEPLLKGNVFESVLLFFDDRVINSWLAENQSLTASITNSTEEQVVWFKKEQLIETYFHSLKQYLTTDYTHKLAFLELKVKELLLTLVSNEKTSAIFNVNTAKEPDAKTKIDKVIATNLYRPLTIEHLAFLANKSLSQFKRDFKSYYHMPPAEWLREKRLSYASQLLLSSNDTVGDICIASGFLNTSHFIKTFKEKYNRTPNQYRKSNANL